MRRRNRRRKRIYRLAFLGVLILALVAAGFLFQVRKIKVYGNERHSSKEISSGLLHDVFANNTLHLLWLYRDGRVPDTLPFLDSVQVQMKSPSSIEVAVTEKELAGCIDKGGYVYFDKDGIVLEITDELYDGLPLVTGASSDEAVLYQKLPIQSSAQLRTILSLIDLLQYHELEASEIRFGENMEIIVFVDKVEALLGQDEYLEEKVANMSAILQNMNGASGTLHLESFTGKNEDVTFTYSDQTEPETDTQEAGTGPAAGNDGTDSGTDAGTDSAQGLSDSDMMGSQDGGSGDTGESDGQDASTQDTSTQDGADTGDSGVPFMAFNASGTLVYDVRVVNGVAVDANGTPVEGVTVNEDGYVVDAYMNVIDPATGQLAQ